MREYPSVPDVFRVASSHNINNLGITAASLGNTKRNNKHNQQQHPNGCGSQSYNSKKANNSLETPIRSNSYEQQQPVHKMNTAASMERACHEAVPSLAVQHSPYSTLPRSQPQIAQSRKQNLSVSSSQERNMVSAPQSQASAVSPPKTQLQQMGVINTISGSIPATGVSLRSSFSDLQLNNNYTNQRQRAYSKLHQKQQQTGGLLAIYKSVNREQISVTTPTSLPSSTPHGGTNGADSNNGYLWLLTPVAASISVAIVIAALAGPQWLFTEEKLPNANYNGTANFNALDDGAYITKYTKSSLWILCTALPGVDTYNCIKIDYFPKEGYQPDPHDSTPAIPYTVTKSCPIFLIAGMFLIISFMVFLIPTCSHQNNIYYFSAGILFIVSGLVMLIGLIAYISILKAEIGSKLRPRSTLQPALFKVTYGQSFFLFVFGFIITEFVGVLNIFLYINLQEISYYSRFPCLSATNINEKIKEGEHPITHSYRRFKQPGVLTTANDKFIGHRKQKQPKQQQVLVDRGRALLSSSANGRKIHRVHDMVDELPTLSTEGSFPSHVNAIRGNNSGLNLYLHNEHDRRYYLEKPVVNKCNLHSRNFAKSQIELCTEPVTQVPLAPLNPAQRISLDYPLPIHTFGDLPQEFPLTRSVSTTTDIYSTTTTPLQRNKQRNMATNTQPVRSPKLASNKRVQRFSHSSNQENTDDDSTEEHARRLCGLTRSIRKTKDELFEEFCRRAGMRNKPKSIYYIDSEEDRHSKVGQQHKHRRGQYEHDRQYDLMGLVDNDDEDGDDHGFKQFHSAAIIDESERHDVDDHDAQFLFSNEGNHQSRSSLLTAPLRKLNSNLSLHTPQSERRDCRRSLRDLDNWESVSVDIWPALHYSSSSQICVPQNTGPPPPPQSRTLPRCFLRQSLTAAAGSQDSLGSLQSNYNASQQCLAQLKLSHQQQLQQKNCYVTSTHSRGLHKPSAEDANATPVPEIVSSCPQQAMMQWPAVIPSSPATYSANYRLYAPAVTSSDSTHLTGKFQRAYAFDEQHRRASFAVSDAFDLDEIERDRRRSHANLFVGPGQDNYDLLNGTAV